MKPGNLTKKASQELANHDWHAEQERHDDPVDFLVRFLDFALAALSVAATDKQLRPEQRTAAAYACSHAVRQGSRIAAIALSSDRHYALADVGLQEAVADAVDAFHAAANAATVTVENAPHFTRLPINIAADGKPFESCANLLGALQSKLGSATGFSPKPSNGKRGPAVGGKWNALALKMRQQTERYGVPLQPPSEQDLTNWVEWQAVENALERNRERILNYVHIRRWRNSRLVKDDGAWAELKKEVRRALESLAKNNRLANSDNSPTA